MLLEAPHPYHVPDMPKEDIKLWGERIVRAMEYQVEDEMDGFHDPLEDHPKFHHTIRQALARAKIVDSSRGNWPYCHVIWKTAKEFLREEHGIVWFSPAEMNPGRIFD